MILCQRARAFYCQRSGLRSQLWRDALAGQHGFDFRHPPGDRGDATQNGAKVRVLERTTIEPGRTLDGSAPGGVLEK